MICQCVWILKISKMPWFGNPHKFWESIRYYLLISTEVSPQEWYIAFSDVDIGIYVKEITESGNLALELGISLEFDEELPGNVQSDLRVINDLPLSFLGQIVTKGVLVYCRDDPTRIDFETSVRMAYFDFLPVLKMHQNEYLNRVLFENKWNDIIRKNSSKISTPGWIYRSVAGDWKNSAKEILNDAIRRHKKANCWQFEGNKSS